MHKHQKFSVSWFFRWFLDNQAVTVLMVTLLVFLNIFILTKISFILTPIVEFLAVIMLPIILACLLYYLLNPIVNFLVRHRVPRNVSITLVFVGIALLLVWGLAVFIPNVQTQMISFSKNVPSYAAQIEDHIDNLLKDQRFDQFRPQINEFLKSFNSQLLDLAKNFSSRAVGWVTSFISTASQVVIAILIMPFILFYLLRDGQQLNSAITQHLPTRWREPMGRVLSEVNLQLSNYVRGQVTVAIIVAIMFSVMFSFVGLKYAVTLGIVAGALNLIPYLGSFLAMIPAVVLAMIEGPFMLIKVLLIFMIEQTIEGRFVTPLILGSSLQIHPITILFVLLTSGNMFGLWGVLLGIPVYASLKVILGALFAWYKEYSGLYQDLAESEERLDDK